MVWPLKDRGTFQRSPFKFRAAAKSPSIFSVSFRPRRTAEGRKILALLVTCADLTFADPTFADGLSQYLIIKALWIARKGP